MKKRTLATVVFGTTIFDQNSDFDGTSTLTFPVTGRYLVIASVYTVDAVAAHDHGALSIVTSNRDYAEEYNFGALAEQATGDERVRVSFSAIVDADAADTAVVKLSVDGGTKIIDIVATQGTAFSACLLA